MSSSSENAASNGRSLKPAARPLGELPVSWVPSWSVPVAWALVLALLSRGAWTGFTTVGSDGKSISTSATGEGFEESPRGISLGAEDAAVNTYGKGQDGSKI